MDKSDEFDFSGIYPQSKNLYDTFVWGRMGGKLLNDYSPVCSDFYTRIDAYSSYLFQRSCVPLGFYLDALNKNKASNSYYDVKPRCYYFFYKLNELVKRYGGNCGTPRNCYKKMRDKKSGTKRINVPTICEQFVNNIEGISDDIFNKIYNIEQLYIYLEKLKNIPDPSKYYNCGHGKNYVRICNEMLEKFTHNKNKSFDKLLKEFNHSYDRYKKIFTECDGTRKRNPPPPKPISVTVAQPTVETLRMTATEMQTRIEQDPGTGIGTGIFVSTFVSLIIIFIFYKV
ncbi:variable surface protein, partial [Plasmodium gonderi]